MQFQNKMRARKIKESTLLELQKKRSHTLKSKSFLPKNVGAVLGRSNRRVPPVLKAIHCPQQIGATCS